jgi:hypothetical protein
MTVGCAKTVGACPNAALDIIADHKGANIAARNERGPSASVIRPCLQKQISIIDTPETARGEFTK